MIKFLKTIFAGEDANGARSDSRVTNAVMAGRSYSNQTQGVRLAPPVPIMVQP